jgi:hypothetical protein
MDPTGIFFLYVIASPQAECQARVNVNATHGTKTRVAYVSLHLMGSSRSIYPAGITIGITPVLVLQVAKARARRSPDPIRTI